MSNILILATLAAVSDPEILVAVSREPVDAPLSGVSVSVIDRTAIEALALPAVSDLLRLTPNASVSVSGPLGSQTQVRLRGAESNHTLVMLDGIELNDPASSNDARLESLLSDAVESIEIIRGPQTALWGPEAIGGVVSLSTLSGANGSKLRGSLEAGSHDYWRVGAAGATGSDRARLSLYGSRLHNGGTNIAPVGNERDGFDHREVGGKAVANPADNIELGVVARYARSRSEFDGFDYMTSQSVDEDLETRYRAASVRGYGTLSLFDGLWTQRVEASLLDSASVNSEDDSFVNRTDGQRFKLGYQSSLRFAAGGLDHRLTAAFEHEHQRFRSRDVDPLALSNQKRARDQDSLIGEYHLSLDRRASLSLSVRHDANSDFADATTWRAAAAVALPESLIVHASYGEGVADPTFIELYGFFPDFFVGNPDLTPERARGFDVGLGWNRGPVTVDVTYFRNRLKNEIISTFDFMTFLSGVDNATGTSHRQGIEATVSWAPMEHVRIDANYAWLDADEATVSGVQAVREVRRARHSGGVLVSGKWDRLTLGASAAYVGARRDLDFATFPATRARLSPYVLASLSGAYRLTDAIELTARVENAFDEQYQDVIGYRTPGIGAFAGLKVKWGD